MKNSKGKTLVKRRLLSQPKQPPPSNRLTFTQVNGRIIERVEISAEPDYQCVCIRFQDNTDLNIVMESGLLFRAELSKWKAGNQRVLKRWPMLSSYRP